MNVVVVDYGLGNLRSVAGALQHLGHAPVISHRLEEVLAADRLILPGVGAFGDGMANLHRRGLVEPLHRRVLDEGTPILGICLGAQLFAQEGHEFGRHKGLGWVEGTVDRLAPADPGLRVPHVGWNDIQPVRADPLLRDVPPGAVFYFVHSYHVRLAEPAEEVARADHGGPFTAAFRRGNIAGTQFHPEKSQRHGLAVLRNFLEG